MTKLSAALATHPFSCSIYLQEVKKYTILSLFEVSYLKEKPNEQSVNFIKLVMPSEQS